AGGDRLAVALHTGEGRAGAPRPPLPPFTEQTARQKVQAAEDAWNTRDPERVAGAYTEDSVWRNRHEFLTGRAEIVEFLRRKWSRELDYALRKDLWSCHGNRIAVRFQNESHYAAGQWYPSYGNELCGIDEEGGQGRRGGEPLSDAPLQEREPPFCAPRPKAERGLSSPARWGGTLTGVTIRPPLTSQRPVRLAGGRAAANVPAVATWTVMLRRPGRWPVRGYHALYTASFAQNSTRSQGTPGLAVLSSASHARSAAPATPP